jgi:4-amino-4-deoxy-L-arabinose transferase-like glycosyltransferase
VSSPSRALLVILALSLVVRLALWVKIATTDERPFWDSDTRSYHQPALALLELGEFAVSPEHPEKPETYRTPGYPAFLAGVYSLFGESAPIASLVQIVIGVGTLALAYEIGSLLCGARVGLWSAALLACDPVSLALHELLMSETLFAFLLAASAANGLRLLKTRGTSPLGAGFVGLLIGLATLVRPVSYFLGPVVAVLLALCGAAGGWRQRLSAAVALLVPVIVIVGGWQVRNYARTGHAQFSEVAGRIALVSRGAAIVAWRDGLSLAEARRRVEEHVPSTGIEPGTELAHRQREAGVRLIRAHPLLFVLTEISRAGRMLCGPGEHRLVWLLGHPAVDAPGLDLQVLPFGDFLRKWVWQPSWVLAVFLFAVAYLAVLNVAILRWLWLSIRTRSWRGADVFLWGILVYFLAVGMTSSRFRMPIMPLLVVYAAQGLRAAREPWPRRPRGHADAPCGGARERPRER